MFLLGLRELGGTTAFAFALVEVHGLPVFAIEQPAIHFHHPFQRRVARLQLSVLVQRRRSELGRRGGLRLLHGLLRSHRNQNDGTLEVSRRIEGQPLVLGMRNLGLDAVAEVAEHEKIVRRRLVAQDGIEVDVEVAHPVVELLQPDLALGKNRVAVVSVQILRRRAEDVQVDDTAFDDGWELQEVDRRAGLVEHARPAGLRHGNADDGILVQGLAADDSPGGGSRTVTISDMVGKSCKRHNYLRCGS